MNQNINNIFIGIDGGGTKCKVRIENTVGQLLAEARGGPANIRLSVAQAWQSVLTATNRALKIANIDPTDNSYTLHAGMALAGTEIAGACEQFLINKNHPFASIELMSDAYAACLGAHNGDEGSIIIVGTGVIGWQIEANNSIQVGGWGFPHADDGGGAWLGLKAVRLTMQWQDGRIKGSALLAAVLQKFNNDFKQLVVWANNGNATDFAQIAPIVIEYVACQDPLALQLIRDAAKEIDKVGSALQKQIQTKDKILPCCLFGGIAPFIEPWLGEQLKSRLVPRQFDANRGAILRIRKKLTT